jgi:opacity protein-like surface antigen
MKRILFLLLAAASSLTPAVAADLPAKAPTSPVYTSWSGLYLGVGVGENLGSFSPIFGTGKTATEVNLDDNSPFVGGHIGYLVQSGNFVVGPEFGIQYWGAKKQAEVVPASIESPAILLQQKIDWLTYANVRAGVTIFSPRVLAYATGGAAWAHVKGDLVNLASLNTAFEQSIMGFNIGAGLEFKLTEYLTLGGEFRHYDFGKVSGLNPAIAATFGGVSDKLIVDQLMARLSYRLN